MTKFNVGFSPVYAGTILLGKNHLQLIILSMLFHKKFKLMIRCGVVFYGIGTLRL